jgi:hypothetical protein
MFINGMLVDYAINTVATDIAGADEGGTSRVYDQICTTRDTNNRSFTDDSTFTSCEIWRNQFTDETGVISTSPTTTLGANTADLYSGQTTTISGVDSCIIRCTFTVFLLSTSNGILYEAGGSSIGMALYIYNGSIYCQAGSGFVIGGSVELSFQRPLNRSTLYIQKSDDTIDSLSASHTTIKSTDNSITITETPETGNILNYNLSIPAIEKVYLALFDSIGGQSISTGTPTIIQKFPAVQTV